MKEDEETQADAAHGEEREALLMRLGGLAFAVYADECECVTPWAEPAPLPHAPAAVLGVMSVRGRMRTVLDPARLFETLGLGLEGAPAEYGFVASLRGDEQLALVFEAGSRAALTPGDLRPPADSPPLPVQATCSREGETVYLLDPSRLFDAAMSGTERRRRRTGGA